MKGDTPYRVWTMDEDSFQVMRMSPVGMVRKIVVHDEGVAVYGDDGMGRFLPWHKVAEVEFAYDTPEL